MIVPLWVVELAAAFWTKAGTVEPFPRHLRGPITWGWPVAIVYLPRLRWIDVRHWLRRNRIPGLCDVTDRRLRACLVARSGSGFIFIDGADTEDEQRFSLAHELAHFLRDYWQPRRQASERLGESVLEVFDGLRPPTPKERLDALLVHVSIGFHLHLMDRDADGQRPSRAVALAEDEADRLAYELLAPAATILDGMASDPLKCVDLIRLLRTKYGLPAAQANAYAALLLPSPPAADPLLRHLGLAE